MRIDKSRTRTWLALAGFGVVLAVLAALIAAHIPLQPAHAAEAQRWGGRGGPGGRGAWLAGPFGRGGEAFLPPLHRLGLSDEQREQVRTIMGDSRESAATTAREMREARAALAEAVTADGIDEAGIRSRAARVGTLEGDAALRRARLYAAVRNVLTPEQRERADEMQAERRERFEERRERMQERRERRRRDR